jgi:DNA polymerase-4
MPMAQAVRHCPDLLIITPRHSVYSQMSDKVMERLRILTPLVEQISIDEAFMDVSDLPETGEKIAIRLQSAIWNELKLPCSIGVATNKLVAKMATDAGKSAKRGSGPPNAITVVPPGMEAEFIAPLPVQALWGVGPKTAERLRSIGAKTIGDIALLPEEELVAMFGKTGRELAIRSRGVDDQPVITEHELKSISQETTFARDVHDEKMLRSTVTSLAEAVGIRLRASSLMASTVKLKIRWPDFTTLTRQMTLSQPNDQDSEIILVAMQLFEKVWKPGRAVRLIGIGVSGLRPPIHQLSFWGEQNQNNI